MKGKEALIEVMGMKRMSQTALASILGYSKQSGVANRLQGSQDMRVDTLAQFLKPMNCELIIRDKDHPERIWVLGEES